MSKSNVSIHYPQPGLHGYGIEYNADLQFENADATQFVKEMQRIAASDRGWFHQCGHNNCVWDDTRSLLLWRGYQYFELWAIEPEDQDYLLKIAESIAQALGVEVEL